MNNKKLLLASLLLTSASSVFALPQCPQPEFMEQRFSAPNFETGQYKNGLNRSITWLPNYHMIHDEVAAVGNPITMTAKFDYGRVVHKDLEFETVKFYIRGQSDTQWQYLTSATTNSDGKATLSLGGMSAGQYRIYAGVVADGTGTEGYLTVVEPNTEAVLFDIDGTLTESDAEQVGDYTEIDYADAKDGAYTLVRSYLDLGYQPIFLTARVYWYGKGTRRWLSWMGLPPGYLRTSLSNETSLFKTAQYKTEQINKLEANGIKIVRAYGNAKTDAEAFIKSGLSASQSFTIGEEAGYYGTTAISNNSYNKHIATQVNNFPNANCQ
ncbi:phosphatidylinositol transfer protein [Pseudoalteromonas sp. MMG007]|uniref:LNS2 domain-containing protein n=1 Tax=Pseudoalteromonas sp. MMG007 TaxID=2822684 RepID=UPI001B39BF65|nr:phosphatidylinositol transfer protein [Pseudoalteromonas sp. MMG007]MBQ4856937.1 phosphatidylinositol transfer protein [Pseudoalteromonas sp. MMG007]